MGTKTGILRKNLKFLKKFFRHTNVQRKTNYFMNLFIEIKNIRKCTG